MPWDVKPPVALVPDPKKKPEPKKTADRKNPQKEEEVKEEP